MSVETEEELSGLKRVGSVVAEALRKMRSAVQPGVSTAELDAIAARVLAEHGARAAPLVEYRFPGHACISVNDEAVHGIPGDRRLHSGDLVTLDVTAELDGYYADAALTVGVGSIAEHARKLIECAESAFARAARVARAGVRLAHIGGAIEAESKRRGFRVMRELCGHGIGRGIHEEPSVSNFYDPQDRRSLTGGLVLAVEPIVTAGVDAIRTEADGWTISSADGSITAHYEHTIVITRGAPLILTA